MKKLKYNGTTKRDTVVIDTMRTTANQSAEIIHTLFRAFKVDVMPKAEIEITFWIFKKKRSWMQFCDKRIHFKYDLYPHEGQWILAFEILNEAGTISSPIYRKAVKYDCTTKKILIKELLEEIITHGKQ